MGASWTFARCVAVVPIPDAQAGRDGLFVPPDGLGDLPGGKARSRRLTFAERRDPVWCGRGGWRCDYCGSVCLWRHGCGLPFDWMQTHGRCG